MHYWKVARRSPPTTSSTYLIDPWRRLAYWNKPANKDDAGFEVVYNQAMSRTSPWEAKRIVLRGRTTEVIHLVPDASWDLCYVDADHTLRRITIDLIRVWSKVRPAGCLLYTSRCV